MRVIGAVLVGLSVLMLVSARRGPDVAEFVGRYVRPPVADAPEEQTRALDPGAIAWAAVGSLCGILMAQGDLFVAGPSRPVPVLAALGAAAGLVGWSARRSTLRERAARRLRYELPVVCDALALSVVSGESVASSMKQVVDATTGVARDELAAVLAASENQGLESALADAARLTVHPEAGRLYQLLAHAHLAGGRLADALMELGVDVRAGIERDLTAESGRRMVSTYGPVLALMVPTALLFLLYPTLMGLRTLSGVP